MNTLFDNIELTSKLLNAIWLRIPIIVHYDENDNKIDDLADTLISLIPDYRKFIICGNAPKRFIYQKQNAIRINLKEKETAAQNILSSYEEENISSPPLQLFSFNTDQWFFDNILSVLDRGWIALTLLDEKQLTNLFNSVITSHIKVGTTTLFFLHREPNNNGFEQQLLTRFKNKSLEAGRLLIQKKMSEIRYVGQALTKEIEQGNTINQYEVEEIYSIDTPSFLHALEVLKSETRIDISQYLNFTPRVIATTLKQLNKLPGLMVSTCLWEGKIIGIEKKEPFEERLFFPFYSLLLTLKDYSYLHIEFDNNRQLLMIQSYNLRDYNGIIFGFILEKSVNIKLLLNDIADIFKEL